MTRPTIDVYPVGLLADLKHRRPWRIIAERLRRVVHGQQLGYLNGYLAEVNYPPEALVFQRCGHGWTQRRALARLGVYLAEDNPGQGAAGRHPSRSAHIVGPLRWWVYTLREPRVGVHLTWTRLSLARGRSVAVRALDVHLGTRGLAISRA